MAPSSPDVFRGQSFPRRFRTFCRVSRCPKDELIRHILLLLKPRTIRRPTTDVSNQYFTSCSCSFQLLSRVSKVRQPTIKNSIVLGLAIQCDYAKVARSRPMAPIGGHYFSSQRAHFTNQQNRIIRQAFGCNA